MYFNTWYLCISIHIIYVFQYIVLRNIVDAPWYVRNVDLHRDLKLGTVTAEIIYVFQYIVFMYFNT